MEKQIEWCFEQHRKTNHLYDDYLPYEFHLNMTFQVFMKFIDLIPEEDRDNLSWAIMGHDLIEDTRVTYNDVKRNLGEVAADIIYAVTNNKGKNRKERAGDDYYAGIRATKYADFVKLCDRIANVSYSKMSVSNMYFAYAGERKDFINKIGNNYPSMIEKLNSLFK